MLSGPREGYAHPKKIELSEHAKKWGELMAKAIDGVRADAEVVRSLLSLLSLSTATASERALEPAARALAAAGADPLKKTRRVEDSEMAPGRVSPLTLSAFWVARAKTDAFFAFQSAFPESAKKASSEALAAFGAGMALRVDEWEAETNQNLVPKSRRREWLSEEKKARLAEAFADADPCELAPMSRGSARLSFAYALGMLCQPNRVGASEFEEGVALFKLWLARSRASGREWSAEGVARALAHGASDSGQVSSEQNDRMRLDVLPRPHELDVVWLRAQELLELDPALKERSSLAQSLIASGWAKEAALAAKEADRGEETATKWANFAEAARDRLEAPGVVASLGQDGFEKALESLSAGAARAARRHRCNDDDGGEEPIGRRLERFALSAATRATEAAPSKPAPRI